MSDAHTGKQLTCRHPDDDSIDDLTTLDFDRHGRYVQSPRGEDRHGTALRDRFEQSALRFDCPDCGATRWVCPVCSDHLKDDADRNAHRAAGWFYGESTGDALACHNCNAAEAARQTGGRI